MQPAEGSASRPEDLARVPQSLARRLGLPIRDFDLLEQALVHSSYLHEHPETARAHNERLEFLGDSVVNVIISEALFVRHPRDDEGSLSARRAAIVSTTGLSRLAVRIELGDWLLLGEGEAQRGGRRRPALLASAFEALTGAVYLDLGYAATQAWLLQLAAVDIEADQPIGALKSPKSRLQEYTQRRTGARPTYRIVDAIGPDHEKQFRIEVIVEDRVVGSGEGPSRRVAETAAAARALARLRAEQTADGASLDSADVAEDGGREGRTRDERTHETRTHETRSRDRRADDDRAGMRGQPGAQEGGAAARSEAGSGAGPQASPAASSEAGVPAGERPPRPEGEQPA